jgi:hypothetical protein
MKEKSSLRKLDFVIAGPLQLTTRQPPTLQYIRFARKDCGCVRIITYSLRDIVLADDSLRDSTLLLKNSCGGPSFFFDVFSDNFTRDPQHSIGGPTTACYAFSESDSYWQESDL